MLRLVDKLVLSERSDLSKEFELSLTFMTFVASIAREVIFRGMTQRHMRKLNPKLYPNVKVTNGKCDAQSPTTNKILLLIQLVKPYISIPHELASPEIAISAGPRIDSSGGEGERARVHVLVFGKETAVILISGLTVIL